jgi:hypothetical protein
MVALGLTSGEKSRYFVKDLVICEEKRNVEIYERREGDERERVDLKPKSLFHRIEKSYFRTLEQRPDGLHPACSSTIQTTRPLSQKDLAGFGGTFAREQLKLLGRLIKKDSIEVLHHSIRHTE